MAGTVQIRQRPIQEQDKLLFGEPIQVDHAYYLDNEVARNKYKIVIIANWPAFQTNLHGNLYTFWLPDPESGIYDRPSTVARDSFGRYMARLSKNYEFYNVAPKNEAPVIIGYNRPIKPALSSTDAVPNAGSAGGVQTGSRSQGQFANRSVHSQNSSSRPSVRAAPVQTRSFPLTGGITDGALAHRGDAASKNSKGSDRTLTARFRKS